MNCSRCNKRLSRKRARQIDGKVLCSACLFGSRDRGSKPVRAETGTGSVHESPGAGTAIAQTPDSKDLSA